MLLGTLYDEEADTYSIQTMIFSKETGGYMFADRIDEGPTPISTVIMEYDFSRGLFARGEKEIEIISYDSKKCRF